MTTFMINNQSIKVLTTSVCLYLRLPLGYFCNHLHRFTSVLYFPETFRDLSLISRTFICFD